MLRYEVNFEPDSGILNDLYQGYVRTPPGEWTTLALPLNRLLLTGQGQVRELQRKWDDGMALKSIGFTIADGVAGPFQLDVAWVSLVQKVRKAYLFPTLRPGTRRLSSIWFCVEGLSVWGAQ